MNTDKYGWTISNKPLPVIRMKKITIWEDLGSGKIRKKA
jgi:hypothetical protein